MRKLFPTLLAAILAVGLLGAAFAEDKIVHQKGRAFSTDLMTVHKGESITFVNDDTVPHNIMSTSEDGRFDLGSQSPGTAVPVAFDTVGSIAVICAIHPRMKMTVKVID